MPLVAVYANAFYTMGDFGTLDGSRQGKFPLLTVPRTMDLSGKSAAT